jgi:hypothetical protein
MTGEMIPSYFSDLQTRSMKGKVVAVAVLFFEDDLDKEKVVTVLRLRE